MFPNTNLHTKADHLLTPNTTTLLANPLTNAVKLATPVPAETFTVVNPPSTIRLDATAWVQNGGLLIRGVDGILYWNHLPITYHIDEKCGDTESIRFGHALEMIQNATNNDVRFNKSTLLPPNIVVTCNGHATSIGESGLATETYTGNIMDRGNIDLFGVDQTHKPYPGMCQTLNTEIHETLHLLGIGDTQKKGSIMTGLSNSCDDKIDPEIIEILQLVYNSTRLQ